jgi:hypothetical protein
VENVVATTTARRVKHAVNRLFVNRIVRAILRSPFHRVLSGRVLVLTFSGRSTGRVYALPLVYLEDDAAIYCCTLQTATRWWKNLLGSPQVRVLLRGEEHVATTEIVEDLEEKLRPLTRWLQKFRPVQKTYGVSPGPDGDLDPDQVRRAADNAIVVRVRISA